MKLTLALASIVAVGAALPAMAQTSYYIVQDSATHHCRIVSQRPVTHDVTIIGDDGYPTEVAAQTAMRTVKLCTED